MADMRDRLIEVIEDVLDCKAAGIISEWLAKDLIASGVILPPCEVGDVLWDISEFVEGREHPEMHVLHVDEITIGGDGFFVIDGCSVRFEDFGKTLFLTREEAEKALKERKEK